MLIRRASDVDAQPMTMEGVKDVSMRLMVGRADGAPNFAMRCFTVAPGGHTPRHQHDYEHEVFILQGHARVEHDGEFREVSSLSPETAQTGNFPKQLIQRSISYFHCQNIVGKANQARALRRPSPSLCPERTLILAGGEQRSEAHRHIKQANREEA